MSNNLRTGFIDNSSNEFGFKIYADGQQINHIIHRPFVGNEIDNGSMNNVSSIAPTTGEAYDVISEDVPHGNIEAEVEAYNTLGASEKTSLGTIESYNRTDFIIYIGDEDVIGNNHLNQLSFLKGHNDVYLDSLIEDSLQLNNIKTSNTNISKGSWRDADPTLSENHGAEVSLIDSLQARKHRQTAIWKLGIPSGLASTTFGPSGEGRLFIDRYLQSDFDALFSLYHQARVKGVIINLTAPESNYDIVYQQLIDYFRDFFNHPELPILLTNKTEGDIEHDVSFKIEKVPGLLGEFYDMRGMTGYYRQPIVPTKPWWAEIEGFEGLLYEYRGGALFGDYYARKPRQYVWDKVCDLGGRPVPFNVGTQGAKHSPAYIATQTTGFETQPWPVFGMETIESASYPTFYTEAGWDHDNDRPHLGQNLDWYCAELGINRITFRDEIVYKGIKGWFWDKAIRYTLSEYLATPEIVGNVSTSASAFSGYMYNAYINYGQNRTPYIHYDILGYYQHTLEFSQFHHDSTVWGGEGYSFNYQTFNQLWPYIQ